MTDQPYVFVVEDNGPFNELLTRRLERRLRARVVRAARAEFVYAPLGRLPAPDVVVMDFQLATQVTGVDLAAWMLVQLHLSSTR